MDTILLNSENVEVKEFDFSLPEAASYIVDKQQVTFSPETGNTYSHNSGARLLRFKLGSHNWLNPKSLSLQYTLKNKAPADSALRPFQQPYQFFKRMRVLLKGALLDDIDDYNRVCEILNLCKPENEYNNILDNGFVYQKRLGLGTEFANKTANGIAVNGEYVFSMNLLTSLGTQDKFIPLQFCDVVIELELDSIDPTITLVDATSGMTADPIACTSWEIINPSIKCEVVTLDSAIENKFIEKLLMGKDWNIGCTGYTSVMQTMTSKDTQINVSRSLSKLKKVFVSYVRTVPASGADTRGKYYNKDWNSLYAPRVTGDELVYQPGASNKSLQKFQVAVGSRLYPDYPVGSLQEARSWLQHAFNHHPIAISGLDYFNDKFLMCVDLEKIDGKHTGVNVKNQPIFIHSKTESEPTKMHVIMEYDKFVEITDVGVNIFD
jgi:hypothetical protein